MTKMLIVVDVQNDFCEGGALPIEGGNDVAYRIDAFLRVSDLAKEYDWVVFSRDWHKGDSNNGGHFSDDPNFSTTWPVHCVRGSEGAQYNPLLKTFPQGYIEVFKGVGEPAYSAFEGVYYDSDWPFSFADFVLKVLPDEIDVCGLALDHCVKETAIDASALTGKPVTVLSNLTAPVSEESGAKAIETLKASYINIEEKW